MADFVEKYVVPAGLYTASLYALPPNSGGTSYPPGSMNEPIYNCGIVAGVGMAAGSAAGDIIAQALPGDLLNVVDRTVGFDSFTAGLGVVGAQQLLSQQLPNVGSLEGPLFQYARGTASKMAANVVSRVL